MQLSSRVLAMETAPARFAWLMHERVPPEGAPEQYQRHGMNRHRDSPSSGRAARQLTATSLAQHSHGRPCAFGMRGLVGRTISARAFRSSDGAAFPKTRRRGFRKLI